MKNKTKNNTSNNSDFLSQSELESLIRDMREAEIKMGEMIRNHPNFSKIKELLIEIQNYPKDSIKRLEINKEIFRLQKEEL